MDYHYLFLVFGIMKWKRRESWNSVDFSWDFIIQLYFPLKGFFIFLFKKFRNSFILWEIEKIFSVKQPRDKMNSFCLALLKKRLFPEEYFGIWRTSRQADTKDFTSSSKFSGSCVLTLQTLLGSCSLPHGISVSILLSFKSFKALMPHKGNDWWASESQAISLTAVNQRLEMKSNG